LGDEEEEEEEDNEDGAGAWADCSEPLLGT
jgi:hypothetical protein